MVKIQSVWGWTCWIKVLIQAAVQGAALVAQRKNLFRHHSRGRRASFDRWWSSVYSHRRAAGAHLSSGPFLAKRNIGQVAPDIIYLQYLKNVFSGSKYPEKNIYLNLKTEALYLSLCFQNWTTCLWDTLILQVSFAGAVGKRRMFRHCRGGRSCASKQDVAQRLFKRWCPGLHKSAMLVTQLLRQASDIDTTCPTFHSVCMCIGHD